MGRYLPGNEVVLTLSFKDEDGEPADPATATALLRAPDGEEITLTVTTLPTEGDWEARWVIPDDAMPGTYKVRGEGTGGLTAAEEHSFTVLDSAFAP